MAMLLYNNFMWEHRIIVKRIFRKNAKEFLRDNGLKLNKDYVVVGLDISNDDVYRFHDDAHIALLKLWLPY